MKNLSLKPFSSCSIAIWIFIPMTFWIIPSWFSFFYNSTLYIFKNKATAPQHSQPPSVWFLGVWQEKKTWIINVQMFTFEKVSIWDLPFGVITYTSRRICRGAEGVNLCMLIIHNMYLNIHYLTMFFTYNNEGISVKPVHINEISLLFSFCHKGKQAFALNWHII